MKHMTALSVVVVMCSATLFAGGQDEQTQSDTFRVMWWGSQNRHERTIETLDLYSRNEALDIIHEFAGWNDYWTKVTTMAAGRSLPDVMQHDYQFLSEWQSRGLVQSLEPFIEAGQLDFSDVSEANLNGGRIDGELYGVNLGVNSQVFVIDVDMFEEAGVPIPSDDWTWTDFEEIVLRLHEELGVYGYGAGLLDVHLWKSRYLSEGMWVFTDEGDNLGYTDDRPLIEHLEMVVRLQEAGAIPHISREASDFDHGVGLEIQPIVTGEAAMHYMWSNQLTGLWTAAGGPEARNFALVMVPRVDGGLPAQYVKPSMFFTITRDAANPEEAARFIDFVTNDSAANQILMAERGVPIANAIRSELIEDVGEIQRAVFEYMDRVAATAQPIPPPDPPGYTDLLNNVYDPTIEEGVRFGVNTPEEAVAILRREATQILGAAN